MRISMPYMDVGWEHVDPTRELEYVALFAVALDEKTKHFVDSMCSMPVPDLIDTMSCVRGCFWGDFAAKFDGSIQLPLAAIVYTMLTHIPHRSTVHRQKCCEILHTALRTRASLMVLRVIVQLCPLSLTCVVGHEARNMAHLAITYACDFDLLRVLLYTEPRLAQMLDTNGLSLLHYAVLYGMPLKVVEYLYNMNPASIVYRTIHQHDIAYAPSRYSPYSPMSRKHYTRVACMRLHMQPCPQRAFWPKTTKLLCVFMTCAHKRIASGFTTTVLTRKQRTKSL